VYLWTSPLGHRYTTSGKPPNTSPGPVTPRRHVPEHT